MRIVLVSIYPGDTIAGYLLSSYVLKAYLAHALKDLALEIEVVNFSVDTDTSAICDELRKRQADCIGFSCYVWNIAKIRQVTERLKVQSPVVHVFGGPEISLQAVKPSSDGQRSDFYVIGEGERPLANLIRHLAAPAKDSELPKGVAAHLGGIVHYRENDERIQNLEEIPSVYLSGSLDEKLYAGKQAFLETQRGCIFKCKYCVYHKHLSKVAYYPLSRVFDELEHLIIKKRVFALRIFDAVFTSDLDRAKQIVDHIIKLKSGRHTLLSWIYWEFNYWDVDEEFLALVSELKMRPVILNSSEMPALNRPQHYSEMIKGYTVINCLGVQSFCREALKAMGRASFGFESLRNFMEMVRRHNVVLKIDLILGLPFETFESYFAGLEAFLPFFKDTDHVLNIHRLQILPNSDLAAQCEKYQIEHSSHAPYVVFATNGFSRDRLEHAARLTAVLFRIVNSPLRKQFFEAVEKRNVGCIALVERIYNELKAAPDLAQAGLFKDEAIYDTYWNGAIFKDIPSERLLDILRRPLGLGLS